MGFSLLSGSSERSVDLVERRTRYKAIEDFRKRPLIVYATSTRPNVPGMMAGDSVREFIDQIDALPDARDVDVLVHSTGGDALAAWKLMSVLRERFDTVAVLVPFMSFSAATLFALGADEIVMHPHGHLGRSTLRSRSSSRTAASASSPTRMSGRSCAFSETKSRLPSRFTFPPSSRNSSRWWTR